MSPEVRVEALLVRLDRVVHSDMHHGEVEEADLARAYWRHRCRPALRGRRSGRHIFRDCDAIPACNSDLASIDRTDPARQSADGVI